MGKKEDIKEFYLFDDIQTGSFIIKNNVTYFLNGCTDEDVKDISTAYVSVDNSGAFFICGKDKETVGVPFVDKLLKIVFDTENNSITVNARRNMWHAEGSDYSMFETFDENDFNEMYENIPLLLSEQGVHKFKKRKYKNKLTLNFEVC